ncbi:MAG TPA: hypothetical protein VIH86_06955 [Puia sp.]|jgi:hypothetical protein
MKKNSDLICIIISTIPIIVLLFLYNRLPAFPNTKISGSNGLIVSKNVFIAILTGLGVLWYFLSMQIAQRLVILNSVISQFGLRSSINILLSALSLLLILSNI